MGRPAGIPNRINKEAVDARLAKIEENQQVILRNQLNVQNELAEIKASLPRGCDPKDYVAGRESAKKLLGKT
jgi:hypothetical protein